MMSAEKPSGMSVRIRAARSGSRARPDAPLRGCTPATGRRMSLAGRFTATDAKQNLGGAAVADRAGWCAGVVHRIRRRCGRRSALGLSAAGLDC